MGVLIAPVQVRDLKVDYIYKLWGSLAPDPAGVMCVGGSSLGSQTGREGGLTI